MVSLKFSITPTTFLLSNGHCTNQLCTLGLSEFYIVTCGDFTMQLSSDRKTITFKMKMALLCIVRCTQPVSIAHYVLC